MKRQIAFVLALVLCVLPLAACANTDENLTYKMDKDILADIGLTPDQMKEKYGPPTREQENEHNELIMAYYGSYESDNSEGVHKPQGNYYLFENGKCVKIDGYNPKAFLSNYENSMTPEEVAERYGMKLLTTKMFTAYGPDAVKAFYVVDGLIVTLIMNAGAKEEHKYFDNAIFTYDYFNVLRYYAPYPFEPGEVNFDPRDIESRYQIFSDVAIGVPEGATIEDFLNDPLAQAIKGIWIPKYGGEEEMEFFGEEGKVTSGKLTPGMYMHIGTDYYRIIPYVEELETS